MAAGTTKARLSDRIQPRPASSFPGYPPVLTHSYPQYLQQIATISTNLVDTIVLLPA